MSATVEILTATDLEARRAGLLARAGMTEAELAARADRYELSGEEADILDDLRDITYLLSPS